MMKIKKTGVTIVMGIMILFIATCCTPVQAQSDPDYVSVRPGDEFDYTYTIDAVDKSAYSTTEEEMFLKSVKASMNVNWEVIGILENTVGNYTNISFDTTYKIQSGQTTIDNVSTYVVRINDTIINTTTPETTYYTAFNTSYFLKNMVSTPWDLFFISSNAVNKSFNGNIPELGKIDITWQSNGVLDSCSVIKKMNVTRESIYGGMMTMEIDVVITIAPKSQQVPGYSTFVMLGCASFSVVLVILVFRKKARFSLEKQE